MQREAARKALSGADRAHVRLAGAVRCRLTVKFVVHRAKHWEGKSGGNCFFGMVFFAGAELKMGETVTPYRESRTMHAELRYSEAAAETYLEDGVSLYSLHRCFEVQSFLTRPFW